MRRARTSRRTFYEHFADKEACFVALLTDANAEMIRQISAAVDPERAVDGPGAPGRRGVDRLRGVPARDHAELDPRRAVARRAGPRLQRDTMEAFVTMIQTLCDTEAWRAVGVGPVPGSSRSCCSAGCAS